MLGRNSIISIRRTAKQNRQTAAILCEVIWILDVPDSNAHIYTTHRQFLECERRVRQYALSTNTMDVRRTIHWIFVR